MSASVLSSEWAIILSDWKNADANVTVHLRGGQSLGPGKVSRIPHSGGAIDSAELHARKTYDKPETKWTFDLTEVVAITAEAS